MPIMVAAVCVLLGCVLALVGLLWSVIVAWRQSPWWVLVYLFVPFGWLVLLVRHWSAAWPPFALSVVAVVAMVIPFFTNPVLNQALVAAQAGRTPGARPSAAGNATPGPSSALQRELALTAAAEKQTAQPPPAPPALSPQRVAYNQHLAAANQMYATLNDLRGHLPPKNQAALDAFNQEAARYHALLEQIAREKAELDHPTAAAAAAPGGAAPASRGPAGRAGVVGGVGAPAPAPATTAKASAAAHAPPVGVVVPATPAPANQGASTVSMTGGGGADGER